jgi:uncharacterized membrane protein
MLRGFPMATLAVAVILFPADMIWLKLTRPFYESQMGALLLPQPRIGAAIAFYCLYVVGAAFFAVLPNLQSGTFGSALLHGALLGAVAYGTYDATNYATLKDFPLSIMLVDWTWGIMLTAFSSAGAWTICKWISSN